MIDRFSSEFPGPSGLLRRDVWITETAALFTATCILIAIAVVLRQYEGSFPSDRHALVTLNNLLSVFVTGFYLMCLEALSTCVSKLRWLRFRFYGSSSNSPGSDKAAQKLSSSIKVLLTRSYSYLLVVTALSCIIVFAVGPFVQQVLDVKAGKTSVSLQASLPVSNNLTSNEADRIGGQFEMGAARAVYTGAFAPTAINFNVSAQCPTGNCTWDEFATFIFQSRVKNVTADLVFADNAKAAPWLHNMSAAPTWGQRTPSRDEFGSNPPNDTLVSLPNSNSGSPGITVSDLAKIFQNQRLREYKGGHYRSTLRYFLLQPVYPLCSSPQAVSRTHIYYQEMDINGTSSGIGLDNVSISYGLSAAWEVDFEIALQPLRAKVLNGQLTETPTSDPISYDLSRGCTSPFRTEKPIDTFVFSWRGQEYNISIPFSYMPIWSGIFFRKFSGSNYHISTGARGSMIDLLPPWSDQWSDFVALFYTPPGGPLEFGSKNSTVPVSTEQIEAVMQQVAKSTTLWLRTADGQKAAGHMYNTPVMYVVTWKWMIVPVVLLVMTGLFHVTTLWGMTRSGIPVWVHSNLAVTAYNVDEEAREKLFATRRVDDVEGIGGNVRMQLLGPGLTLRQHAKMSDA